MNGFGYLEGQTRKGSVPNGTTLRNRFFALIPLEKLALSGFPSLRKVRKRFRASLFCSWFVSVWPLSYKVLKDEKIYY